MKQSFFKQNRTYLLPFAAFALAALFLLIGTKSSPLYPMNDWVDVNVFMTLGRGILDGKVPYRDLFEQKGPVLFFLHALLAVFFKESYFGVYLAEVIFFGLFLWYSARITGLYVKNRLAPYLVMIFLGTALPISPAFSMGGGVEEMHLFLLTGSLFYILRALREGKVLSIRKDLFIGAGAGCAFWSKYTFCGFYGAIVLFVIIWHISRRDRFIRLLQTLAGLWLGFMAVTAPVLIYFGANGALGDLIKVYFIDNLTMYSRTEKTPFEYILEGVRNTVRRNMTCYGWLFFPGAVFLICGFVKRWRESLAVLLCFIGLAVTTYMSSPGYIYYGLILAPFALSGLIALAWVIEQLLLQTLLAGDRGRLSRSVSALFFLCCALLTAAGMLLIREFSENSYLMDYRKEDMPQYQFAEIIRQTPNATLLNYWFLDGGFYYAAGVEPINYYFCYFNINPPKLAEEQQALINSGAVDYVVRRTNPLSEAMMRQGGYELAATAKFFYSTKDYDYFLYRKIP